MIDFSIYGGTVQLSGNQVEVEVTNDAITGESPRALLKATSTDGAVPGGPFKDSRDWRPLDTPVEGSGKAVFDFQEYLDAPPDWDFTFPYGASVAIKHPLRAFDIDILAGASYIDDDPLSATYGQKIEAWQAPEEAVSMRILKGGLSQDRQSQYNEANTNFYQDFIQGNKYLTNRPNNQRISYNQPVRLWYLLPGAVQVTRALYIVYTLDDGTAGATMRSITIDPDGLYEFILDPLFWDLPTNTASFTVFQMENLAIVGEMRTFYIDSDYYENNTFLFFANSLSGIDDVWFTGAVKLTLSTEGETGLQQLDRTATTRDRSVIVTGKTGSRKWSIFPGNRLNVADMESLQDLLYSKFIWIVWNGKTVPVNLENGDFDLTDTKRDLIINDELELVFTEGHKNNYY
jgi:hypothetical protein